MWKRPVRWVIAALVCLLAAGCYRLDNDDDPYRGMAGRKEAQAYIVSAYNKLSDRLFRQDFEALLQTVQSMDGYRWDHKDSTLAAAKGYVARLLNGDFSALPQMENACRRYAGVYEAGPDSTLRKVADASEELRFVLGPDVTVGMTWHTAADTLQGHLRQAVVDLALTYNHYTLAGTTRVYADSVSSAFRMEKDGDCLLTLSRLTDGQGFLSALAGRTDDTLRVKTTDLKVQLAGMLCLHDTQEDLSQLTAFVRDNRHLQLMHPKEYLEGWTALANHSRRTVLTKPDGTLLCRVTQDVLPLAGGGGYTVYPRFGWSDGTSQSLSEFATATTNQNFMADAALVSKLWTLLAQLSDEGR